MKMKKITSIILCILTLTMILCFATCCVDSNYIGTYNSIFVDSQSDDNDIKFSLEINKDKTFTLSKSASKDSYTYKGTWKSYTESGQAQLLCLIEEGYDWNEFHPNAWHPYFTLNLLDDGTLMAIPSSTFNSYSSADTAFGKGDVTYITLVLFEKN